MTISNFSSGDSITTTRLNEIISEVNDSSDSISSQYVENQEQNIDIIRLMQNASLTHGCRFFESDHKPLPVAYICN